MAAFRANDSLYGARLDSTHMDLINHFDDPAVRDRFISQYSDPLVAYLSRRCRIRDRNTARDIVNDFFVQRVLRADGRPTLVQRFRERQVSDPSITFRPYLLRSLFNFYSDRVSRASQPAHALPADVVNADAAPIEEFEINWANNLLIKAIALFKDECLRGNSQLWSVFYYRYLAAIYGSPGANQAGDLCDRLGLKSRKQASNLLVTARRKFNRILRELVAPMCGPAEHESQAEAIERELAEMRQVLSRAMQLPADADVAAEPTLERCGADFLALPDGTECLWNTADYHFLWEEVIEEPITHLFTGEGTPAPCLDSNQQRKAAHLSLRQLWSQQQPPVELLMAIKDRMNHLSRVPRCAPSFGRGDDASVSDELIPREMQFAIYIVSIAAGLVKLRKTLSRDEPSTLRQRLTHAMSLPWLDTASTELLDQAVSVLSE